MTSLICKLDITTRYHPDNVTGFHTVEFPTSNYGILPQYLITTELLRKVKIRLVPWRTYKAGKAPQEGVGVTKGHAGSIAGGNSHSPSKFVEVKELEKNRKAVQTFQEVGTSLEDDFHGYFLACDISIISRQIVSNLILELLHY